MKINKIWVSYQNLLRSNCLSDVFNALGLAIGNVKCLGQAADVEEEIGEHLLTIGRQIDLRMELNPIDVVLLVKESRNQRGVL